MFNYTLFQSIDKTSGCKLMTCFSKSSRNSPTLGSPKKHLSAHVYAGNNGAEARCGAIQQYKRVTQRCLVALLLSATQQNLSRSFASHPRVGFTLTAFYKKNRE
jgi:hypothetical protein